jgi:dCMP deaminase
MKQKFLDYFMKVAQATSELSTATRLKVGTVIVRGNQILATGYNGTPSGWDNQCEDVLPDGSLKTKPIVIHSESNAITKVARSTESSEGSTLFCTHAPCLDCAKLIYQSGINSVYYRDTYRDTNGLEFLERSGVKVEQYRT